MILSGPSLAIDRWVVDVTLRRFPNGAYADNGEFVEGTPVETSIKAYVQSPSNDKLTQGPEGQRLEVDATIYTRETLVCLDENSGQRGDEIIDQDGSRYLIVGLNARREGAFTRAYGKRVYGRSRDL